jgi:uncharacterized membrane protein
MAQWYATSQGQQYGPVPEQEMRDWLASGRIKPTDNVWTEGMPAWIPAAQAFPAVGSSAPPALPPAGPFPELPPRRFTGLQSASALISQSWRGLSGCWGLAIGFCVLMGLIQLGMAALGAIPCLGALFSLGRLLVSGAFELGLILFFLTLCRGGNAEIGMLFAGFRLFGKSLGAFLLVALLVFLWSLLLIVPGIIKALAYSQTFYIIADNPNIGILEAISRSRTMMNGRKADLFVLDLLGFLISLLGVLTLCIGFLWIVPLLSSAHARFYDTLHDPTPATAPTTV